MRQGPLAISLLLLSCGNMGGPSDGGRPDGGTPGAADRSGTRLKVVYERWDGQDGSRVTIATGRFLDTKLDVECTFQAAEDGLKRCLPVLPKFYPGGAYVSRDLFLDAACTKTLLSRDNCAPAPKYAVEAVPGPAPCGGYPSRMHQVEAPLMAPSLYRRSGATCAAVPPGDLATLLANVTIHPTAPVAPDEFVSGDYQSIVLP